MIGFHMHMIHLLKNKTNVHWTAWWVYWEVSGYINKLWLAIKEQTLWVFLTSLKFIVYLWWWRFFDTGKYNMLKFQIHSLSIQFITKFLMYDCIFSSPTVWMGSVWTRHASIRCYEEKAANLAWALHIGQQLATALEIFQCNQM